MAGLIGIPLSSPLVSNDFISTTSDTLLSTNLTEAVPALYDIRRSRTVHRTLPMLKPINVVMTSMTISAPSRNDYD